MASTGKGKTDQYSNMMVQSLLLSAANTLTTQEVNVGLNIFDKVGLLLQRVEYEPAGAAVTEMTASGDQIAFGLTTSSGISSALPSVPEIIDVANIFRHDMGAAASGQIVQKNLVRDFSGLGGGGLLVPPKPLYVFGTSVGLASAATIFFRIYFLIVKLTDSEYLELLETRRAFG